MFLCHFSIEYSFGLNSIDIVPSYFICFTLILLIFSFYGLVSNTENFLFTLISMELLILSISLNFIYFSVLNQETKGQIVSLLLLGIAASEASVGLSLLLVASHNKHNIKTSSFRNLKG